MRYYSLFIVFLLVFSFGCKQKAKRATVELKGQDERVQQMLPKALSDNRLTAIPSLPMRNSAVKPILDSFYLVRENAPAWFEKGKLSKSGDELVSLLASSMNYGLDSTLYNGRYFMSLFSNKKLKLTDDKIAATDVALSYYAILFTTHISVGRLDSNTFQPAFKGKLLRVNLPEYLDSAIADNKVTERVLALQPNFNEYRLLQKGLTHFMTEHKELIDDSLEIPDYKKDSIASYTMVKKILLARQYIDTANVEDAKKLFTAIKQFQADRGLDVDGKPGKFTRIALSTSDYDLYCQAAASLERWRWETDMAPNRAWVNLPAYHLKIVDNDQVYRIHRVIVGKPETPSPEVSSRISYFIVNPFWSVPFSIATKELIPHMQKNENYLTEKHYRVFDRNNKEVEPSSINWQKMSQKNFNYSIRRDAGDFNDLGFIKFIFSNPYSIYLHDTPSRNLFTKDTRGLSHGCIRLEKPFDFAGYLLKRDSSLIGVDSLDCLVERAIQKTISLKKPMPIYTRYITTEGDTGGRLNFYQDMYGRDKIIRQQMLKTQSKPAV